MSRLHGEAKPLRGAGEAANESVLMADCHKLRETWIGNKGGFLYRPDRLHPFCRAL